MSWSDLIIMQIFCFSRITSYNSQMGSKYQFCNDLTHRFESGKSDILKPESAPHTKTASADPNRLDVLVGGSNPTMRSIFFAVFGHFAGFSPFLPNIAHVRLG